MAISITKKSFDDLGLEGKFKVADIYNLPYEEGEFDIVMSFGVLEHFEDIAPPVREMCRVLKSGGIFHADVIPNRISVRTLEQFLQSISILLSKIFKFQLLKIGECINPFKPDFYENSIPIKNYLSILNQSNMIQAKVYGVRAFPFITLPRIFDNLYSSILKVFRSLWSGFDNSGSILSVKWGVIFAIFAVKK